MTEIYLSLTPIDIHFGRFLSRSITPESDAAVIFAAGALASNAVQNGSICLDLNEWAGRKIIDPQAGIEMFPPDRARWRQALLAFGRAGEPGEFRPLILDGKDRLYLQKYFVYQENLADNLRRRIGETNDPKNRGYFQDKAPEKISESLRLLAEYSPLSRGARQQAAALLATRNRLTIISGGPGTGKTTAVSGIIFFLQLLAAGESPRVALAAPTGKAAVRLQEVFVAAAHTAPRLFQGRSPWIGTLHRLMGARLRQPFRTGGVGDPLPYDLLVIDEASMIDLPLMARVVASLPQNCHLILLGDSNQLASVEAGYVFSDICNAGRGGWRPEVLAYLRDHLPGDAAEQFPIKPGPAIQDALVELQEDYRFPKDSAIRLLNRAVVEGDPAAAMALLESSLAAEVRREGFPATAQFPERLAAEILPWARRYFAAVEGGASLDELLGILKSFGILCALRIGPFGSLAGNDLIETILCREGVPAKREGFYPGRPIIVTKNDYALELFNGDIGVIMPGEKGDEEAWYACFPAADPQSSRRAIPARLLGEHETGYAITIHKSQGSEYGRVLVVIPPMDNSLLTRELLYTAISRAKVGLTIWAEETTLRQAIERKTSRHSGLRDALLK